MCYYCCCYWCCCFVSPFFLSIGIFVDCSATEQQTFQMYMCKKNFCFFLLFRYFCRPKIFSSKTETVFCMYMETIGMFVYECRLQLVSKNHTSGVTSIWCWYRLLFSILIQATPFLPNKFSFRQSELSLSRCVCVCIHSLCWVCYCFCCYLCLFMYT